MSDPERLQSLMDRWLDGAATSEETAELDALLRSDLGAAEAFARTGKLDAALRDLTRENAGIEQQHGLLLAFDRERRRRRRLLLGAAAVAATVLLGLGLASWLKPPPPDDRLRDMEVVEGRLLINGKEAKRIPNGSLVTIPLNASATVRLADDSRVELRALSRAVLHGPSTTHRQRIELLEGSGRFRVATGEGEFEVGTFFGRVRALGTDFTVRVALTALLVEVVEGSVQVEAAGKPLVVSAGESRRFSEREARGTITSLTADEIVLKELKDRPGEIAYTLASGVLVLVDNLPATPADLKRGMTAVFQTGKSGSVITAIRAEGPTASGTLRAVDVKARTIALLGRASEGRPAQETTYTLTPQAQVMVNEELKPLEELVLGFLATVRLSVDRTTVIGVYQTIARKQERERK